jgi:tetratricopeptide (TPR) repeat protein
LVLAISYSLGLIIINREAFISKSLIARGGLIIALIAVLSAHGFGTYQRNTVWNNSESLWHDVTIKSPKNARGLMNYGNAMMARGKYDEALSYFQRTLDLWPTYSYAHVNMGVLLGAMGKEQEAETYFKNGIRYGKNNPEAFYFYANWLVKKKRFAEAQKMLETALSISPMHTKTQNLLETIRVMAVKDGKEMLRMAKARATKEPTYENYINLSLAYYKDKNWEECINAANTALELKPNDAGAYNNICTACIQLGLYEKAIENCNKAISIAPNYQLAKNNLNWALTRKDAELK